MKNYYKYLNVKPSAGSQEIRAAFRKLSLQWHPDRHKKEMRKAAHQKFVVIMEAYEILGNPGRRQEYHQYVKNYLNKKRQASLKKGEARKEKTFQNKMDAWRKKAEHHAKSFSRQSYDHFAPKVNSIINMIGQGVFRMLDSLSGVDIYNRILDGCLEDIKSNPRDVDAYYGLGFLCSEKQQYREAARFYKKALSLAPYDADIYYNLGVIRKKLKEYNKAEKCFRKYISLKPHEAEVYYQLGALKNEQGEEKEVSACVNQLKKMHRKDLVSRLFSGVN
ncbi:MAG: DnaJ domain-containing protein [Candidatus Omnitrophica bacterium]|nr:DnaJ domain-containing protein [Candidatus Omnitrophota bacterium]